MIANFFNKTKPINFLVLALMMAVLFVVALISTQNDAPDLYGLLKISLLLFLAVLIVFVLNFIIRKNSLSEDNSFAIFFFIILCGLFPQSFGNTKVFISNFILLLAFRRIYSLRSTIQPREKLFDSAFWIGISGMIYPISTGFLILVYVAIWYFRKGDWRYLFIPMIGYITPVFISFTYWLAVDDLEQFYQIWNWSTDLDPGVYFESSVMVPLILITLLALIAIVPTTQRSLLAKIDFKSTWFVMIAHIFTALLVVLFAPDRDGSELMYLFFPLSVLYANYVQHIKRYWIKEAILYLFVISLLFVYL